MNNTDQTFQTALRIEALLFALGRPLSRAELCKKLELRAEDLAEAIALLKEKNAERGIALVDDGNMLELRSARDAAELIERVRKEEYAREIGRAGLEVLAAILYRGPLSRADIDFIRGINSSQTLRTLLMRGLIRKTPKPNDERSFLYEPTVELLATLGVTERAELPEYEEMRAKLSELETAYRVRAREEPVE
jgi:segregation and condensation protein B